MQLPLSAELKRSIVIFQDNEALVDLSSADEAEQGSFETPCIDPILTRE